MGTNIIRAIINLVSKPNQLIRAFYNRSNRIQSTGMAFEEYIKDLFAGTVNEQNNALRIRKLSDCFSYLGNDHNPPDCIIRNGDAIEIKKIQTSHAGLSLNSSYPMAKLVSSSKMITNACRNCEKWTEKDIIYIVGVVKRNFLSKLCMVYGTDYAASEEVYEKVHYSIKAGINSIQDIGFSETNEIARVNRIDPLGITSLRVRNMWVIVNPLLTFEYVYQSDSNKKFNFMAIVNHDKYAKLDYTDELEQLSNKIQGLRIKDVEVQVPDNPALLRQAKLITYTL